MPTQYRAISREALSRSLIPAFLALLVTASGCGFATSDSEQTPSDDESATTSQTSDDTSDLPGKPNPHGPGRIKEGLHLRPGVEFAELTREEARQDIEFGDQTNYVYATGSARDKLVDKDRRDVLVGPDYIYLLDRAPVETDRGLKVDIRKFSLIDIIWGDFEITFPIRQKMKNPNGSPQPRPPYRSKKKSLNCSDPDIVCSDPGYRIPFVDIGNNVNVSATLDISGNLNFDYGSGLTATFEGRIPFVKPNHQCNPPDYNISACAFGGCLVDEDFCVEKVKLVTNMNAGVDGKLDFRVGGRLDVSYPASGVKRIVDMQGPPITVGPIGFRPDFYIGYQALFRADAKATFTRTVNTGIAAEFGVEYTDDDGVNFINNTTSGPNDDEGAKSGWSGPKNKEGQGMFRLKAEAGLEWAIAPAVTASGKGLVFEINGFKTSLEARWDTIYTFSPVSKTGSPVEGSCLRSRFFIGPYISASPSFEAGLNFGPVNETESVTLLPGSYWWRPFQWNPWNADGGGDFCQPDRDGGSFDPGDTGGGSQSARPFKVEAIWEADTDVDIHVITPNGERIDASNPTGDGGKHVLDVCGEDVPCSPSGQKNAETVIFYPPEDAPDGDYTVWVTNDDGRASTEVLLWTRRAGRTYDSETVQLSGSSGADSQRVSLSKKSK